MLEQEGLTINQKFDITGMTCSACSSRIEKSVSKLDGIQKVSVNLLTNSMQAEFDDNIIDNINIIKAVEQIGYGAYVHGNLKKEKTSVQTKNIKTSEIHQMKIRLIGSFAFLIPLMYVSMHHMLNEWFALPIPEFIMNLFHGNKNAVTFGLTQFILLLPILYLNRRYFIVGFKTLWHRNPNMDSLVALGSAAATLYGIFALFRIGYGLGHGNAALVEQYSMDLYFESAATILTLITLGKYLEAKSKGKTSEAIEKLINLAPKTAIVERNGVQAEIPVDDILLGDTVVLKPGGSVAVDGLVLEGASGVDESAITGESIPVQKSAGDKVIGGTINKAGFLKYKATKIGEDTTLSQIIQLVEDVGASKAPIAKTADKISGVFVPIVISIAILSFIIWLITGAAFEFALSIGISVLVISCPCALGLATPVAIMVGTGKGAENGILIKSGEALETLHKIDTVVLDKTGTITEGKPTVTDVKSLYFDKAEFIKIASGLEQASGHPLAESIVEYASSKSIFPATVTDFNAIFGKGVIGKIDGKLYIAGNSALLSEYSIDLSVHINEINKLADDGKTPMLFADDKKLIGIIAVADVVKKGSKSAISTFKKMGVNVIMLTGDNKRTAKAIQKLLSISEVAAEVLPQDKEQKISSLQKDGHIVAMVGDGINDAPALMRSDVGIAIGAGTDIAIESADIVLMHDDLNDAAAAIQLSKAVIKNIKQNLFWAFFYNSIGIPIAAGIFFAPFGLKLNPMFAAAAMSFSSVFVVLNALRLKFFKPKYQENKKEIIKMEKKIVVMIDGMSCNHCSGAVTKALNSLAGVSAVVSLEEKKADVTMPSDMDISVIKQAIEDIDFTVVSINE